MDARQEQIRWHDFLNNPDYKWYVRKLEKMLLIEHLSMTKGNEEGRIRYNLLAKILHTPRKELADIENFRREFEEEEAT